MLALVFSVIATLGLFFIFGFVKIGENSWGEPEIGWKLNKRQLVALFGLAFLALGMFTKVPANSVGIVYSPIGGTKEETISEGYHTKNVLDKIYPISTEVQTTVVENLTTQTKDAQFLTSVLDIKYRVDASDAYLVFKQFRTLDNMSNNLIVSATQRVLEHITTQYNVIDILGEKRNEVYAELQKALSEELALYGVEFYSITINDMDAGAALEQAITEEAVAKKAVETAEQNLLKAQTEAKQKSVQAQAEQDAAKIQAETKLIQAEAEKKANALLEQSLSDSILRKEWIAKWNGQMPTYYGDSDNLMIGLDSTR